MVARAIAATSGASRGRRCALLLAAWMLASSGFARADGAISTIERVKPSIVAVGTYERTRSPGFQFRATGFVVGNGTLIATNAHVLPVSLDSDRRESLAIVVPSRGRDAQVREARIIAADPDTDLALLKVDGPAMPALKLAEEPPREGQSVLFTGFPIGSTLGMIPATHRGMLAAITPIAIPAPAASNLDARIIHRLTTGPFMVFQLDATAYPGNSGSPLYDPDSGEVLGVVNMVLVKSTREAALRDPSGISYAIPARHLRALLDRVHG